MGLTLLQYQLVQEIEKLGFDAYSLMDQVIVQIGPQSRLEIGLIADEVCFSLDYAQVSLSYTLFDDLAHWNRDALPRGETFVSVVFDFLKSITPPKDE